MCTAHTLEIVCTGEYTKVILKHTLTWWGGRDSNSRPMDYESIALVGLRQVDAANPLVTACFDTHRIRSVCSTLWTRVCTVGSTPKVKELLVTDLHCCSYCGQTFTRSPRRGRVHRFCSRRCAAQTAKSNHPNGRKTRCDNGHDFTPENTGHRPDGGRWCRACHNDVTARSRVEHPDVEQRRRRERYLSGADDKRLEERKRSNDLSRDVARNHAKQWTGPQLEIAARLDLTDADVAAMTGRTVRAVETIRGRLKDDPRLQSMALRRRFA